MDCELNRSILHGDIFDKIKEIPTNSIDCIITSPPYFGLRDYKIEGQIGLEPDFRRFLQVMQQVMDELRRVLKDSGTCWVNIGDTYNNAKKGNTNELYSKKMRDVQTFEKKADHSIKTKSRFGIPERFYINCIDNGWYARNHIPWVKLNNMPSPVKDRFTNMWESVFFFSKEQRYYFDIDAVRAKTLYSKLFKHVARDNREGYAQSNLAGEIVDEDFNHASHGKTNKQDTTLGADGKPKQMYAGFNARYKAAQITKSYGTSHRKSAESCYEGGGIQNLGVKNTGGFNILTGKSANHPKGKNPGDVFHINIKPFLESHHATFPIELPTKILKCACPKAVCTKCNLPRFPIIASPDDIPDETEYAKCDCGESFIPGIVLDPFLGAGTTALAAEKLGLRWIGIELNEKSIQLTRKRINAFRNSPLGEYTE